MRWTTNARGLLDLTAEQVAIASGLLLTDSDVLGILDKSSMARWTVVLGRPDSEWFRVRPEFLQDLIRVVRAGIGNLPNAMPGDIAAGKHFDKVTDPETFSRIVNTVRSVMASWPHRVLDERFVLRVAEECGEPLDAICNVVLGLGDWVDRDSIKNPVSADWDGVQPLSDLFGGEAAADDDAFIDQKFIDFLAANSDRLDRIHWRNFERLTAEFFRREKYDVKLGPGSKDGGVDLRVWPAGSFCNGPPLMLVQCKRLRSGELVKVEYVKALWTDVQFESAGSGLIATTSQVSPAGKKTSRARAYSLSFAEAEQVNEWIGSMWRYSWEESNSRFVVGTYFLPPVLPIPPVPPASLKPI